MMFLSSDGIFFNSGTFYEKIFMTDWKRLLHGPRLPKSAHNWIRLSSPSLKKIFADRSISLKLGMVIANEFRKNFPSDERLLCFAKEFDEEKVKNFRLYFMCSRMFTFDKR